MMRAIQHCDQSLSRVKTAYNGQWRKERKTSKENRSWRRREGHPHMAQGGRLECSKKGMHTGCGDGCLIQYVRAQRKEVKKSSAEAAWFSVLEPLQNEQGIHTVWRVCHKELEPHFLIVSTDRDWEQHQPNNNKHTSSQTLASKHCLTIKETMAPWWNGLLQGWGTESINESRISCWVRNKGSGQNRTCQN